MLVSHLDQVFGLVKIWICKIWICEVWSRIWINIDQICHICHISNWEPSQAKYQSDLSHLSHFEMGTKPNVARTYQSDLSHLSRIFRNEHQAKCSQILVGFVTFVTFRIGSRLKPNIYQSDLSHLSHFEMRAAPGMKPNIYSDLSHLSYICHIFRNGHQAKCTLQPNISRICHICHISNWEPPQAEYIGRICHICHISK